MVYTLYDAYPAKKDIYIAQGAGHGMSFFLDPDKYGEKVVSFLRELGME